VYEKLHLNCNAYYYSAHNFTHVTNGLFNDDIHGVDRIPAKLIVNANISYEPITGLQLILSGKNLLNDTSREFFKTDQVPFQLLGGIQYQF
jgi:iron complex outermembrane recepter protein